jgi:parvulin-like peptidyl-prolyl isomerase
MPSRAVLCALLVLAPVALAACGGEEPAAREPDVVARVGDAVFTRADLSAALGDVATGLDSATAAEQVVEQWVQRELLVQEARARGLDTTAAVRQLIAESERATLEAAAIESFYAQNPTEPTEEAVRAYYEARQADLALREPYVRLRHLRLRDPDRADEARVALLRAAATPYADSLFTLVASEYADDAEGAVSFAQTYVPESRLLSLDEALGERVAAMRAGPGVAVVGSGGVLHVVQVTDRVQTGTVPPFTLVRDELAERLAVQMRRDTEARLLQQLRAEARAAGRLQTPDL